MKDLYDIALCTVKNINLKKNGKAGHVACALETVSGIVYTGICIDVPCSITICLSNPQKPLIFQGFTPVFRSNLICLPLFLPLRAETRATFYSPPTTLSSSLAEVRFASLVE